VAAFRGRGKNALLMMEMRIWHLYSIIIAYRIRKNSLMLCEGRRGRRVKLRVIKSEIGIRSALEYWRRK
jgi:hypothetical protein